VAAGALLALGEQVRLDVLVDARVLARGGRRLRRDLLRLVSFVRRRGPRRAGGDRGDRRQQQRGAGQPSHTLSPPRMVMLFVMRPRPRTSCGSTKSRTSSRKVTNREK